MKENADKKLAKRLLNGDRRSFDVFFNTYFPRLFRFALVRLDYDHNLADETAQNVLCQAISRMSTYRGEASLFAWLCTFTRHEIYKQRKACGRAQGDAPLCEDDPSVRAALESLLSVTANDPQVAVHKTDVARLVKVAMDHLPAVYADALERKYVHEMSVSEIGASIGKSTKATESILTRARAAFRESFRSLTSDVQDGAPAGSHLGAVIE